MENGNRPINPVFEMPDDLSSNLSGKDVIGLTKREYFAAMTMQGILSGQNYHFQHEIADSAVYMADALLAELNKTKSK